MVYGAIDLHLRQSWIRVVDGDGQMQRELKVPTSRERLVQAFDGYGPMRILLETGTESEWVAEALEAAGHEIIVADPNFAPMYGELRRTVKTDRRDVAALAEANRRGWYRATHRVAPAQREMRSVLRTRRRLVQVRNGTQSLIRALLRQSGYRAKSGVGERLPKYVAELSLPAALAETLAPLCRLITTFNEEIRLVERRIRKQTASDAIVDRLQSVPGVGLIVATTFRATFDDISRFRHAGQVSAAIGLVPREDSSAERRHRGHISKAGPTELRSLLVQAAWCCWHTRAAVTLRAWVDRIADRRGKRIAVVALARRLSRILFALWRDGTTYRAEALIGASAETTTEDWRSHRVGCERVSLGLVLRGP
ncbi:MAG: IS110 family transposase [Vicinamibacterales bacterium]